MDWRETMQRMLVRMEEAGQWPAVCEEARAVLEAENEPSREPAAYLWGGCLWRTDEMERGRPGAVELYRAQTPMTDAENFAALDAKTHARWNPLADDGDALRLAVKLGIQVFSPDYPEYHGSGDACAAVRRAIVEAAARLGAV